MEELLIVAGAHILAVASPGPDLALVLKNALSGNKKVGIYTALGIALGILVHVLYSVVGLALVISQSIVLFNIIKLVGAGYLIWIGVKSLMSSKGPVTASTQVTTKSISTKEAIKQGFLTNVLNPKATLFFLSLYTQVISPNTSASLKLLYGAEMVTATFIWFTLVAIFMTRKPVQAVYEKIKHRIDQAFGVALIALGLKVALDNK